MRISDWSSDGCSSDLQPKGWPRVSPGPNTLLVDDPAAINAKRVEWALAQVDRPSGAYTMMGSAFTSSATAMAPVADAIRRHGIVLLDPRPIGAMVAARTVEEAGGQALSNDMFVYGEPTRRAISTALDRLRSDEHTPELQSLMRISYAGIRVKKNR